MTLDRQFRNLSQGSLKSIEETLPSLLNGLKLIWTISRHISQKEEEFEYILEGISNEICSKVRMEIDIKKIFNEKPIEMALGRIDQAVIVLENWYSQYKKTQIEIESTGSTPRWEFSNSRAIFHKPNHMVVIIKNIGEACKVLKEFKAILGKELKQVTGSSDTIDAVSARVNE
jgi:dynein heavy chain